MRAVVTGADQPIGAVLAEALRASGNLVRTVDVGRPDSREITASMDAAIAAMGGLDLVLVSGWHEPLLQPLAFEDIDDESFASMWEGGMQGLLWTLQAAIPALRTSHGNVIVIVPTTAMSGGANFTAAAATFEAQRTLVKAAARQLGPDGIRVNAIAISPELVLVDAGAADVHYLAPPAIAADASAGDVVDIVHMLTSPLGRHLTGQTITIDGGRWLAP